MNGSEEMHETFNSCCRAVAIGDKHDRDIFLSKLQEFKLTCEDLFNDLMNYCNEEKNIDYPHFKLYQAEVLVYMSLMHYAISNDLLLDQGKKRRFLHWYNAQNRQIQQWL